MFLMYIPEKGLACFLDVETTGLSAATEEIIELSACLFEFKWDSGEITGIRESYTGLREPGVPITPGAARVHGLRAADLQGRKLDHQRIEAILDAANFIVAHNAAFDRGFIIKLFPVCAQKIWLCSMSGIDWYGKGFASRGLQNLLRRHGIATGKAHRAKADVLGALALLSCRGQDGRRYFLELLEKLPREGTEAAGETA